MKKRSKEFLQVAFYLSKFGVKSPPKRLKVKNWDKAYWVFYEKLNGGRTLIAFKRSLKNARDNFDSHLLNTNRVGWQTKDGMPSILSKEAQNIFDELNKLTEEEVWGKIRKFSDLNIKEYDQIIDDLISIQETESSSKKEKKVHTEGGKKFFISSRYERRLSLRNAAIKIHGFKCKVCDFDFKEIYGEWGAGFIEVHHLQALADNEGNEIETNPETDLTVLCANCHRMVHRKKGITLTIEELKAKIKRNKWLIVVLIPKLNEGLNLFY